MFNKGKQLRVKIFCDLSLVKRRFDRNLAIAPKVIGIHIVGIMCAKKVFKAFTIGQVRTAVTQMPFAKHPRSITLGPQDFRYCQLILQDAVNSHLSNMASIGILDTLNEKLASLAAFFICFNFITRRQDAAIVRRSR